MKIQILTLFPEMVRGGLSAGIIGRAGEQGLLSIEAFDIRDYTKDIHRKVDDYPYGGGAGMLMQAQPVYDAWCAAKERSGAAVRTIYLTPQGETFTQEHAKAFAKEKGLILLCGHYEGIDERVLDEIVTDYISIGDYVLTGGELAAMVLTDAVARMVPGVLGNERSGENESFEGELLEYPQYSRPRVWRGKAVPDVLLSGNQRQIDAWRREEAEKRTRLRRPDLFETYQRLQACRERLMRQKLLHTDMIELIARGKARILYEDGTAFCLQDKESMIWFASAGEEAPGRRMIADLLRKEDIQEIRSGEKTQAAPGCGELFAVHQEWMADLLSREYGYTRIMTCRQAVYTRREKLPVRGRYAAGEPVCPGERIPAEAGGSVPWRKAGTEGEQDGCENEPGHCSGSVKGTEEKRDTAQSVPWRKAGTEEKQRPRICRLAPAWSDEVAAHYEKTGSAGVDSAYLRERMEKGWIFGAFVEGTLAGFIGMHTEGSIGFLTVFPEYRRRGIGTALETFLINEMLERGFTPYGQTEEGNTASHRLQETLGLCFSKEMVYWMQKNR